MSNQQQQTQSSAPAAVATPATAPATDDDKERVSINLDEECPKIKERYNECFKKWYSDQFLKGDAGGQAGCEDEFNDYQACMLLSLKNKGLEYLLERDFVKEALEESYSLQDKK